MSFPTAEQVEARYGKRVVCCYCGVDPAEQPKAALNRLNEKGQTGVWVCQNCAAEKQLPHFSGRLY